MLTNHTGAYAAGSGIPTDVVGAELDKWQHALQDMDMLHHSFLPLQMSSVFHPKRQAHAVTAKSILAEIERHRRGAVKRAIEKREEGWEAPDVNEQVLVDDEGDHGFGTFGDGW